MNFPPASSRRHPAAFTLIELLTVIAIIGVLAALLIPVLAGLSRRKYINAAQAELTAIQNAIESYHSAYGVYPPSNANGNVLLSPLYYELEGTTKAGGVYTTMDGFSRIPAGEVSTDFGLQGFVNTTRGAGSEETVNAKNFLTGVKANRFATVTNGQGGSFVVLITSVGGPDLAYQPLNGQGVNPFRYNSLNPTNNVKSYDLWIDLSISGKTNRICNWSRQVLTILN